MKEITISKAAIESYHVFKVKLSPGVVMVVERDVGSKYNQLALTVKLPNRKMVGRVPAKCARSFQLY